MTNATRYPIHTLESAPEASQPLLQALENNLGRIPNLAATMAESPTLLRAFLAVREIYTGGSLSAAEIEVLSLTAAYENDCSWCMTFHSLLAQNSGVSRESVSCLRRGAAPVEPKLEALSDFARRLVDQRGAVDAADVEKFLAAGYAPSQALEVVLGMGFSLMANYAAHVTGAAIDEPLKPYTWQREVHGS